MGQAWMNHSIGDEVRYTSTGQYGIIKEVNEITRTYIIEINGIEYSVSENEIN